MSSRLRMVAALGALAAITGCSAPLPTVSFYSSGQRIVSGPSLWCAPVPNASTVSCAVNRPDADAARLKLATGAAVSVNVSRSVAALPWVVVFRYRDRAGTLQEARGPVQSPGAAQQYVIRLPEPADRLVRVEVQSGLVPVGTDQGSGVDWAAMRTWVLLGT